MTLPRIETRREPVVETIFGASVADPYRWLEDAENPEVSAWIDAQNELTERTLSRVAARSAIRDRIAELLEIGTISLPRVRRTEGGELCFFYTRREGKQNHPVLYVRHGLTGADEVLVDPNTLGGDESTTALDWFVPSEHGELLAYGLSERGTEDSTLHVLDVRRGRRLPDVIPHTRHASIAWLPDGSGFLYSRYPEPGTVPEGEERYHRKIFEHRLGDPPERDRLVFGEGLERTDFPNVSLSPDGRWVAITVNRGFSENAIYLADRSADRLDFRLVTPPGRHLYYAVLRKGALYVMTNEGAPRYRLFAVDPERPARDRWRLLVAEHPEDTLDHFSVIGGELLVGYLHAATSRLERFDLTGKSRGPIALPVLGSSGGFSGVHDGSDVFYGFESFAVPPEIRHLDLTTGRDTRWQAVSAPRFDGEFRVEARSARSKDGTRIPYKLVYRGDLDLESGDNPTLLYGYGGFNVNLLPSFTRSTYALLERGGVYVQANLRGGGELGEEWHREGQLEKKQNTFDDFIAVAEDLVRTRVTRPERLAIHGRSNGGLLVAAAVTQRPDLFRAAVAGVPLTDMIRYPRFLIAKLWVPEYGSPDEPDAFRALLAYSPYHNIRPNTAYPAVLVTTAESDTRVDPLHARKLVAALQHATSSEKAILLRTERAAGHGAGTPVKKLVEELADTFTFILAELGVER
ncbi:MAG TPA: prolyl oligopeptidase family serine peptidase [Polyangiaceae bacterium]|nr:prolyl oligopeptidase family serine peptidase [Polyangiaceae bacterium]